MAAAAPGVWMAVALLGCCGIEIDTAHHDLRALCDTAIRVMDHSESEAAHHSATAPEARDSLPGSRSTGDKSPERSPLPTFLAGSELGSSEEGMATRSFSRFSSVSAPGLWARPPDLLSLHQTLLI